MGTQMAIITAGWLACRQGLQSSVTQYLSLLWHNLTGDESMAASWLLYVPRELHLSQRVTQGCPYKIACPSVRGPLRL